jgi:hypothetical protein
MMKNFLKGLLILGLFFSVSLLFYYKVFWSELFFDRSTVGAVYGETQATEWGMQSIYSNLINGKNPFMPIKSILYPFGIDMVATDAGFAFNFIFFRPFLSPHQSLALIVVSSLILANCGMYVFLRLMDIGPLSSFLMALAYGNMTFLTVRLGHPGYSVIYLFPWFFYFCLLFIKSGKIFIKILASLLVPFIFLMTLWQNIYYFIILSVSCGFFIGYFLIYKRKGLFLFIKNNLGYFLLALFTFLILIIPWLKVLYDTLLFSETPKGLGWNGAIEFSSDIFGVFVPSAYNFYYGQYISYIAGKVSFMRGIFEGFNYPGIIILFIYFTLVIFRKKLSKKIKEDIKPYLWASILFFLLTLGPFIHIAGHWFIQLEEGIRLVFPLPFIILHYIPFIGNIRAPGRLSVGMIFFAYIVCAYMINNFLKGRSKKFIFVFFVFVMTVFIIDHRPVDELFVLPYTYPKKIYSHISQDNDNFSVLEIPFSIRDGFTYFGDFNSVDTTVGQIYYKKPIVTGYSGRIPDYVKQYYQENLFIGYLGRIIDLDIKNNPIVNTLNLSDWEKPNIEGSLKTINFLDIKYIIVKETYPYKQKVENFIEELGYKKVIADVNHYVLYERNLTNKEFLDIDLINEAGRPMLGMGWYASEKDYRWSDRRSSVMFKISSKKNLILHFEGASFNTPIPVKIFVNKKLIGELVLDQSFKEYKIKIEKANFDKGINTVYFIFDKGYRPLKIIPGSLDERQLSGQFKKIWLDEK